MDEHQYLYAIGWANCQVPPLGFGVDPRFPVQSVPCGQLAALASRVGLDRFDLTKLQEGATDVQWLSEVARRHSAIVGEAANCGPVLPLRLGIVFHSRDSLQEKLLRVEDRVADFLRFLGDRREWAIKVYLDEVLAERELLSAGFHTGEASDQPDRAGAARGQGTLYLHARQQQKARRTQLQVIVRRELLAVDDSLQGLADEWRQLRTLPGALLDRPQQMVWNGAFLLPRSGESAFQTEWMRLKQGLAPKGLILEASGPWPAYHFCPALEPGGDNDATLSPGR
jgi:hypothetical protein